MAEINTNRVSFSPSVIKHISIKNSTDHLLNQAQLCLHNKIIEDRCKKNSSKFQTYLTDSTNQEETNAIQQRHKIFAKSKKIIASMNRRDDHKY